MLVKQSPLTGQIYFIELLILAQKNLFSVNLPLVTSPTLSNTFRFSLMHKFVLMSFLMAFPFHQRSSQPHSDVTLEKKAKSKAITALSAGTYSADELNKLFASAVSISSTMVLNLVHILRLLQIPCIRAPYEADAQIAFLYKIGVVDGVLAEDSDFILYGIDLILTKFDLRSQTVKEFNSSRLDRTPFASYSPLFIRDVCILSGCDYLKSPKGIGLKTAFKHRSRFESIKEMFSLLFSLKKVDSEYLKGYVKAWLVFSHQVVYNPFTTSTLPFNAWNESVVESLKNYFGVITDSQACPISVVFNQMSLSGSILPDCCGRLMNPDESRGIAEFLIDTESLISFDFDPLSSVDLCLFLQLNNSLLSEELNENSIMTTHDTDSLNNCHLDTEPDEIRCVFLLIETVRYSFATIPPSNYRRFPDLFGHFPI
ncbi:hypothetical protein RCL1_006383 [Eukaryota sp. TZLM3-RCL]